MAAKVTLFLFLAVCMLACAASRCRNCPDFCVDIYNPVCARCRGQYRTFNNTCELDRQNCRSRGCVYECSGACA